MSKKVYVFTMTITKNDGEKTCVVGPVFSDYQAGRLYLNRKVNERIKQLPDAVVDYSRSGEEISRWYVYSDDDKIMLELEEHDLREV